MSAFLEERLNENIHLGATWEESFNVKITQTASDREERSLVHPYPQYRFRVLYADDIEELWGDLLSMYRRVYGSFAGFRVRNFDEYSTNGFKGVPTAFDQELSRVSAGVWQLQKRYNAGAALPGIGYPVRTIFKPVSGTVVAGIRNPVTGDVVLPAFTVDATTGRVSEPANKTRPVSNITQAAQAVLTVGTNTFVVNESVHVSGVVGMTQINGRRGRIVARTASTITIDINTTSMSAYVSGGAANTITQTGEILTGGCEFDLPCRFDTPMSMLSLSPDLRETGEIEIVELIAL